MTYEDGIGITVKEVKMCPNKYQPSGDEKKEESDEKNAAGVACIRISLSNGPILQFVNETNVKKLMESNTRCWTYRG